MNISEKIIKYLDDHNISNKEIAEEMDVTPSTISHYRNRKRKMTIDFIEWFIIKYNPNLNDLFYGKTFDVVEDDRPSYLKKVSKDDLLADIKTVIENHFGTK